MRQMAISQFKATCLAVLEDVRSNGDAIIVTRRGVPIARIEPVSGAITARRRLGGLRHMARITGDLVEPVLDPSDWDAHR